MMSTALRIVRQYHYAHGASKTAVAVHGLYRKEEPYKCYGVTWWIPPIRGAALATWPNPEEVLALSRLVIVPGSPKNAATFLLARSVKMLDARWRCLVTYADTWQGHTGGIYRASNWEYCGLTKPYRAYLRGGRLVSKKATKNFTHQQMLDMGCEYIGDFSKHKFRLVRKALPKPTLELFPPAATS